MIGLGSDTGEQYPIFVKSGYFSGYSHNFEWPIAKSKAHQRMQSKAKQDTCEYIPVLSNISFIDSYS